MNQIESYHISKSEYGIITLIVNTVDKWVNYNSHESYLGFNVIIMSEDNEVVETKVIPIHEFDFEKEKYFRYRKLEQQEKDQIVIYWIPLKYFKGDEYVEHFKSKLKNELDK